MSPLHIAAEKGNLLLCKYIVKMTGGKGHFQVCTFIMENVENKNLGNKRANCQFSLVLVL